MVTTTSASTPAEKPRSMNRSCIQCRERKIKCDRLDPCNQCVSKGAGDDCKHELRKKRAKNKRPFPPRKSRIAVTSPATTSTTRHDISSWADRPMTSASHHSESDRTPSSSSARVVTPNTSSSAHDFGSFSTHGKGAAPSFVDQQSSTSEGRQQQDTQRHSDDDTSSDSDDSDVEDALQLDDPLNVLTSDQLLQIHSAPRGRCLFALKDVYVEWRAMPIDKRASLIREIRDALPDLPQTLHLLHDVYVKRLHSLHGNVVHTPTVQVVLTELLNEPAFEQRDRYQFGHITTALMVIFNALRHAPLDRTYTWPRAGTSGAHIEPLGQREIRQRQRKILALVKRIQRFESTHTIGSLPELQTAILVLASGKGSSAYLDSVADCAIRSAMRMRMHRLGSCEKLHHPELSPTRVVTGEMAVRCWWALVRRDWSQSHKHRTYRIFPQQFNTRQPLNLFDDELLITPCPRSHLRSTWTHVSYSYAMIDFAIMARTLVDQVNAQSDLDEGPDSVYGWGLASVFGHRLSTLQRDALDHMVQSLVSAFPAHYSLEARYDQISVVDVERWLLHQRLFHLFLTLHMPLVSEGNRPHGSLMYMANHILEIQDKVADICTRLNNWYLNTLHTLRACLVLLMDLFFSDKSAGISGLSRLMTRRKVTAALDKIPMDVLTSTSKLCIQLVRLLVSLEDRRYQLQLGASASSTGQSMVSEAAAVDVSTLDGAALCSRWHATCQLLDVLLNDGYWRSFRKNLLQLDHLIPDWLQKPLREGSMLTQSADQLAGLTLQPTTLPLSTESSASIAPPLTAEPLYTSDIERAFNASTSQPVPSSAVDAESLFAFDPNLFEELDMAAFDMSAHLPQFDMDLLGQQDFEGYGNASQSMDFARLLNEWRVELPLS